MSRPVLIAFCGLLLSVSAFSCDITLPAFWSMQQDLRAPIAWVQAVVPVFLIFQAIGQLVFGPVSDRYGRRPVILAGLALYLVGAAMAGLAHREIAGFASSAYGFFTQITASVLAILTVPLFAGELLPWSLTMLAVTLSV